MYKLAQLKEAEVRGTLAALVDNGIVPVDSQEQFEKVAAETIDLISGYDYDINDVAEASSYALQKVAAEDNAQLALGQLTLQKIAGEIDNDTFDYYATAIVKEAANLFGYDENGKFVGLDKHDDIKPLTEAEKAKVVEEAQKDMAERTKLRDNPTAKMRAQRAWNAVKDAFSGKELRFGLSKNHAGGKRMWDVAAKGALKSGAAYGGLGAALYGGHRLLSNRSK